MATPKKAKAAKKRKPKVFPSGPVYLTEWMDELKVSDQDLATALGMNRETIWKWQRYPTRLNPLKQAKVARALKIWPGQLWMHPRAKAMRMISVFLEQDHQPPSAPQ